MRAQQYVCEPERLTVNEMKFLDKFKGDRSKHRINSAVLVAGVIIAAILLNIVVGALAEKIPLKIDVTENKIFELTAETKDLLSKLDKDVAVYYLVQPGNENLYVSQTVGMYTTASNKIKLESVDVVADPLFAARFKDKGIEAAAGSIVVECGGKAKLIEYMDMMETAYQASGQYSIVGFKLEQKLTNAINYVVSDKESWAYFTTGHGEIGYSTLKPIIEDENISTLEINLKTTDVPENAEALYILGPSADFSAEEIDKLDAYLSRGGRLNITFDAANGAVPNIYQYLNEFWGVTVKDDVVFESDANMIMSGNPLFLIPKLKSSDVTDSIISSKIDVIWPTTKSMAFKTTPGVTHTSIVESGSEAISRDAAAEPLTQPHENDVTGKHTLALAVTRTFPSMPETKIVICGTTQFYATFFVEEASVANRSLLYGILRYFIGDGGGTLSIAPKNLEVSALSMSDAQTSVYIILFGVLPAAAVLIAGLWIWIRRRHL